MQNVRVDSVVRKSGYEREEGTGAPFLEVLIKSGKSFVFNEMGYTRLVVLKMWSPDQRHQH